MARPSRFFSAFFLWWLLVPGPGLAQPARPPEPSTEGFYAFQFSSRTFDADLLGDGASGRAHVLFTQSLRRLGTLSFWLERGFPSVTTDFGVELRDLPLAGGYAQINGGDFLLRPLLPARAGVSAAAARSFYPLQGLRFQQEGSQGQWSVYAGRARRFRDLADRETTKPGLFGLRHLRRMGTHYVGVSFTGITDPTYISEQGTQAVAGIVSGTYYRDVSPWIGVLAEVHTTGATFGARAGSLFKFQSAEVAAMLYHFGPRFPYVYPLYRPGESGVTVSSQLSLGEFSTLFFHVDYVLATRVNERTDLRAEVGFGKSFGSNRPHLYVSYARNQILFDVPERLGGSGVVDLFSLSLTRYAAAHLFGLRVEHILQSTGTQGDQTRAHAFYRRLLRQRSFVNATFDALLDEHLNYRMTAEASLEQPLWRSYSYLVGTGVTYQDSNIRRTGEGVVRLGLTRRIARSGLSIRLEAVQAFSIGLPRSRDPGLRLAFDIGHRGAWGSLASLQETFLPTMPSTQWGSLEGRVLFEGAGVGRVTIYVNGEPRDVTGSNGRFRIRRVPTGLATVRLDIREFETEYGVVGGAVRQVEVLPRGATRLDFQLAVMGYFQGSIVVCEGEAVRPLADVEVTLVGNGPPRTLRTSRVGGFQFDELAPGPYQLIVPAVAPGGQPRLIPVDLTEDLAGYVVRIDCR